jgi:hypothetical protein
MRARSASAAVTEFDLMAAEEDDPRLVFILVDVLKSGSR